MRKAVLLATVIALGAAGAAYAATVQNVYVVKAKVTPAKAGTVPVSTHVEYSTTTIPKGQRPDVVKTIKLTFQGLRSHPSAFKGCSTSRLNDSSQGPSTCPKGSKIGTGHFTALIGPSGSQTTNAPACQAEITLYNGGGNTISYYVFVTKAAGQCPLTQAIAFAGTVHQTSHALVETVGIPASLRHATLAGANFDIAATDVVLDIPSKTTTVKKKKVALIESFACPASHQRQIQAQFTLENGDKSNPATRNVACK